MTSLYDFVVSCVKFDGSGSIMTRRGGGLRVFQIMSSFWGGKAQVSSPSWGAKQVNHLHGFRVSGFLFRASFGPGFGRK
jgi:hypothetical protein